MGKLSKKLTVYASLVAIGTLAYWINGTRMQRNLASEVFDYEQLVALIQNPNHPVRSIDSLLPLLPRDLLNHYVMVYKSRSLQEASTDNPRVILTGSDAKLMLTFNGEAHQAGYNTLEITQFRDAGKEFEMREINFPQNEKSNVTFSEKNPEKCLRCHQDHPRPVWDTYALWPGVYGSEDGNITLKSPEDVGFQAYLARLKTNPGRYANLGDLQFRPFQAEYSIQEKGEPNGDVNFNFTQAISQLNFERITREIETSPDYDRIKYAFISILNRCNEKEKLEIENFIPQELNMTMVQQGSSYPELSKITEEGQKAYFNDKIARQDTMNSTAENGSYQFNQGLFKAYASLRYLILTQGHDIQNWYTSLETVSNTFGGSPHWIELFSAVFTPRAIKSDSDLLPYFSAQEEKYTPIGFELMDMKSDRRQEGCDLLKTKSLNAFKEHPMSASTRRPLAPPEVLTRRCTECHSGSERDPNAPEILFSDQAKMKQILTLPFGKDSKQPLIQSILERLNTKGPKRMPKGSTYTTEEKEAVENYFKTLSLTR